MTDREKLIELMCQPYFCTIADHLIANGVVVREKGEWVLGHVEPGCVTQGGNRPWICPYCGGVISWRIGKPMQNFCPNCGADMRKEENG